MWGFAPSKTSHLPLPFFLCLFFFQPPSLCPFCQLHYNDMMFSQVTDENTFDNGGPVSFRTACVGSWLSNTGLSQGNRVAPDLPLAFGTDGRRSSATLSLFLPGLTAGQRWRNKEKTRSNNTAASSTGWTRRAARLRLSSPRFLASTPQWSKWHCVTPNHKTNCI